MTVNSGGIESAGMSSALNRKPEILNLIGNTPMVRLSRLDTGPCELFVKLENQNPTGSIKDRMAIYIIDQAEKAFGMFFDAAGRSVASVPGPGSEMSKQALNFTEQNMKAAFEHARKLVHATDLQEALRIQSEFLRSQFTNAGEHMRQITGDVMSAARDATKGKL